MATANVGIVSPVVKGAYSDSATYDRLNIVHGSDGATYQAIQAVPAGTALSNTSYWMQITPKAPTITSEDVANDYGDDHDDLVTNTGTAMAPAYHYKIPRGVSGNESIDDTKGHGDTDYVWSAGKTYDEVTDLRSQVKTRIIDNNNILHGYYVNYISDTKFILSKSTKRCGLAMLVKVNKDDITDITVSDSNWRVGVYKWNLTSIEFVNTQWGSSYVEKNTIRNYDGYLLFYFKLYPEIDIADWTGTDIRDCLEIKTYSKYDFDPYYTTTTATSCVSGTNTTVNIVAHNDYVRTGFIRVHEGEVWYYKGALSGIARTSNIRGVAGFSSDNVNSFQKWLVNLEIYDGQPATSDRVQYLEEFKFVIPHGINYIIADNMPANMNGSGSSGFYNYYLRKGTLEEYLDNIAEAAFTNKENQGYLNFNIATSSSIGDCLLFKTPNNKVLAIDTGEQNTLTRNSINECLFNLNINHIDYLIISHFHSDHVGNVGWMITNGLIDENTVCYLPSTPPSEYMEEHTNWINAEVVNDTIDSLTDLGCTIINPTDSTELNIGDVLVSFFNTNHTQYYQDEAEYNNMSVCNYITYGNVVVCCTGDFYFSSLPNNNALKKCTILKTPHHAGHGSGGNFSKVAMQYLNPDVCVTSLGKYYATADCIANETAANVFIHNTYDSVQTWCEQHNVSNYVTGTNNKEIQIRISKDSYQILNNVRATDRYVEGLLPVS